MSVDRFVLSSALQIHAEGSWSLMRTFTSSRKSGGDIRPWAADMLMILLACIVVLPPPSGVRGVLPPFLVTVVNGKRDCVVVDLGLLSLSLADVNLIGALAARRLTWSQVNPRPIRQLSIVIKIPSRF